MSQSTAAPLLGLPVEVPDGLPVGSGWCATIERGPVRFPYDGSVITQAPVGDAALATAAVDAAAAVQQEVADLPAHLRRAVLRMVRDALDVERQALADLLVLETGKPLVDCVVEVERAIVTWEASAEEVARIHGETVPLDVTPAGAGLFGFWVRRPVGVVVGIAGFNYPLLLASHKLAPALAAGCPTIVKPAPATPLATLWLLRVTRDALAAVGAPVAAAQAVTGGIDVGTALTVDARVAAVSFTGSAEVGHRIARAVAPRKVVLELGSSAALVVAADADLDAAADAVVRGGYYASGQACISVQRVLIERPVYDELMRRVEERVRAVPFGDPREPSTRVAPLIDDTATARVRAWVDEAVAAGAERLLGDGTTPTLLAGVPDGQQVWDEEVFGPVIATRVVDSVDEAFETVNRSRSGLHASVFTSSLATALAAARQLDVGGVLINEIPGFRSDVMPYGGVKDSGIGREGPRFAIEELTVTRMVVVRGL
jgi:acyl-CoA reductase-like NAD-dependent aldehyde dehydrogenase